ncbi:hypothetical protein PBI_SCTP2_394 [Salicola phage SCTP-2]|nr:hypothetical protein PBI_SCTP2_394 [Salicola phage SCTP-2]
MSNKERFINLELLEWEYAPDSRIPVSCTIKGIYLLRFLEYIESKYNIKTNYLSGPVAHILNVGLVTCQSHYETVYIDDTNTINQYHLVNITDFFSDKLIETMYSSLWLLELYITQQQCNQFYINKIDVVFDDNAIIGQLEIKIRYSVYYI